MSSEPTYPFNEFSLPTGGVTLRASDGVEFKVYKNILALSSSFFRDMFTLPRPNEPRNSKLDAENPISNTDEQVIDVSESSVVLDKLLRYIYPVDPPSFPGVSEAGVVTEPRELYHAVTPVLEAALKYDMQIVVKELYAKLLDAAEVTVTSYGNVVDDTLALRIYAFACQRHLKDLAHRAVHVSLKGRVVGVFVEELRQITAAQYFHLTEFHRKITDAVSSLVQADKVRGMAPFRCESCSPVCASPYPAAWWVDFVRRAKPILLQSPKSDRVFSSEFVKESLQKAQSCRYGLCLTAHDKWPAVSQTLREEIEKAVAENDMDLSEI